MCTRTMNRSPMPIWQQNTSVYFILYRSYEWPSFSISYSFNMFNCHFISFSVNHVHILYLFFKFTHGYFYWLERTINLLGTSDTNLQLVANILPGWTAFWLCFGQFLPCRNLLLQRQNYQSFLLRLLVYVILRKAFSTSRCSNNE